MAVNVSQKHFKEDDKSRDETSESLTNSQPKYFQKHASEFIHFKPLTLKTLQHINKIRGVLWLSFCETLLQICVPVGNNFLSASSSHFCFCLSANDKPATHAKIVGGMDFMLIVSHSTGQVYQVKHYSGFLTSL